jgi:hypothetical protein
MGNYRSPSMNRKRIQIVRWIARIWSIASIGIMLLFIFGEGITGATSRERLGLLFFPFGISLGMILAWWREGTGGIITVISLLIFYGIDAAFSGRFPQGWAFLVFAAPGFLFVLSSYLSRKAVVNAKKMQSRNGGQI